MPALHWVGKDKVVNHHHEVPYRLLVKQYEFRAEPSRAEPSRAEPSRAEPSRAEPSRPAGCYNRIIHGDNLEALKSLLPEFEGKVDVIYIDPPYNTGNEGWVYNDNVNDQRIKKWLGEVVGKEGEDLSRHDKWLCMMYPRLALLKRLLSGKGLVFISIGKDEVGHLRILCDEVFGASNHVETFIWQIEGNVENQEDITTTHEYVIAFAKHKGRLAINNLIDPNVDDDSKLLRDFAENSVIKNGSANPASVIELPVGFPCSIEALALDRHPRVDEFTARVEGNGGWIGREFQQEFGYSYPIRLDDMVVANGVLSQPCRVYSGWSSARKLRRYIDTGLVALLEDDGSRLRYFISHTGVPTYRREAREAHFVPTMLRNMGTTERASNELERMGIRFPYPKPAPLVQHLVSFYSTPNSIILDSFAGSGTTAHAVLKLNAADGGNRRFILVEMNDYAETITAERVRRVMAGYGDGSKAVAGLGGGFEFCTIGPRLFDDDGNLNEDVGVEAIRRHVAWTENIPADTQATIKNDVSPYFLGCAHATDFYFYYQREQITELDRDFLRALPKPAGACVIYADVCTLDDDLLRRCRITFKKIPRDIAKV